MANHASALKAHRQSVTRRNRNRSNRSELRTAIKKFQDLIADGKTEEAKNSVANLYSMVDTAVRKGVISPNAAARQKSRLTKHLAEAPAESSAS